MMIPVGKTWVYVANGGAPVDDMRVVVCMIVATVVLLAIVMFDVPDAIMSWWYGRKR